VYVSGVAIARQGAWPLAVADEYDVDDAHIADYARSARTLPGFQEYLERYVLTRSATDS